MDARAAQLIADLELTPHQEGGYFRQIYRLLRPSTRMMADRRARR